MRSSPFGLDAPRPLAGTFVPHNLMSSVGSPVRALKYQIAHKLRLLTFSGLNYALFPLGPESSPKYITFVCNYSINSGLVACKVDDRPKPRNVMKHAGVLKEGSPTNRFGSKQLLNFFRLQVRNFLITPELV
jgi:hypothetical protein